ncbi:hypothetical protein PSACC_00524 [Paramicrosporidium saccamoebae]|uniref:Chromatin-remodeling ATPase INO80 n=1 Tax=Paramicrosporidium saccamoebae TaxID=1246581 RepID=A0A2H9TPK9_9FUNG|nr:hypothetical protein PSACC_00524 [Paramicrosporidium saccamoebae]
MTDSPKSKARRRSMTNTTAVYDTARLEAETVGHLLAHHGHQCRALSRQEQTDRTKRLGKMRAFLEQCETTRPAGINATMLQRMRMILHKAATSKELAFGRWTRILNERRKVAFLEKMHNRLKRRGRWLKKLDGLMEVRAAEAVAHEDDERNQIWSQICRKQIPKVARQMSNAIATRLSNARKAASLCAREQQKSLQKLKKGEARDMASRSRKGMREMLQFWKRNEKEERELRKRAEKEATERRRLEEEEREARRQNKKLQFMITQTELYSHFIARKADTAVTTGPAKKLAAGVDFADLDDTVITEHAQLAAQKAVAAEREKLKKFDTESDKHRTEAGGENSTLGQELDHLDFKAPSTLADVQIEIRQPRMLQAQLKGYQIKGLTWLANLYEQMGLGKTIQAISLMAHLAETHNIWGPFLVIAPASTLHNWQQEIARFVPSLRALPYWGNVNDRKTLRKFWNPKKLYSKDSHFHILITSYQLVVADEKYFQRIKWQYMILDEAQAIKSSSSVRWKTLLSFQCRNRLLLTGTPIQNSMQELWALLHFIMPGLFDSHDEFSDWFSRDIESHAVAAEAKSGTSTLNEHQLQRLHMILKPFMLRRVKKDVEDELGAKVEIDVDCSLSGRQRTMYRAIRDKLPLADLVSMSSSNADTLMNIVMQFRKVCNHPELFERTEIKSPFFLHELDIIRPTGRDSSVLYWDGPLQNPLVMRIPKICAPVVGEKSKFLEFDTSIFHPQHVASTRWQKDDAFAVCYTSPVLDRSDIPLILRSGPVGLALWQEGNKKSLLDQWNGHPDELENIRMPWEKNSLPSLEIPDNVRFVCRNSVFYSPRVVAGPISLVVDDMSYMLRSNVHIGQELKIDSLPDFEVDGGSGRFIVMPNIGKLVSDAGKMATLDRLLTELKAGGHRVLIYNQMTRMIDLMEEYLHYRGYSYIRLDGSSKIADRRDLVNDWQSRPDIFVFLLSTRAGGLGINLTAADTVIFYDSDWNPTVDQQAMDRAHRLGQTKQVTVYRLITRNSIEERMRQRAKQKDEIHKVVIAGGEFRQMDAGRPNQKDIVSLLLEEGDDTTLRSTEDPGAKRMRLE